MQGWITHKRSKVEEMSSNKTLQIFVRLQDQHESKFRNKKRGVSFKDHMKDNFPDEMMDEVQLTTPQTRVKGKQIPFSGCLLFPQIYIMLLDCGAAIQETSRVCFQCKKHFKTNLLVCGKCLVERFCSEECIKLSLQEGELHEQVCVKRKSKEGRRIREGNLTESDRVKDGEVISVDHVYNWMRALINSSVMKYRKKHSLTIRVNGAREIVLPSLCKMIIAVGMESEIQYRKGVILCHFIWCRTGSIVNILLATKINERRTVESVNELFYMYLSDLLEREDLFDKNGDFNQIKTYPAYRVIFQEERDGGEIKKIGPFWCLVKDYEYLCEFEFSKDQLNKMKPFVIPIEDWDPIKEWKKNRDNESSDLLTMT